MKLNKIFAAFMLIMAVAFAACNENPPVTPGNRPNGGGNDTTQNNDTTQTVDPVAPDTIGWNIPAECLTVAQAREICAKLADNATTGKKYYVKGWVKKLANKHAAGISDFGNALFYMEDVKGADSKEDFYAYQVYGLNGSKITDPNAVALGDYVVIYGELTNFKYDATSDNVYETVGRGAAYIWKSTNPLLTDNGSGNQGDNQGNENPTDVVGDGSLENPFTANDVLLLANSKTGNFYVKAYIVGQVNGAKMSEAEWNTPFSSSTNQSTGQLTGYNTNLLIANSADETNTDNCVPVQLPSGALRTGLNLVQHPEMDGQEILIYGSLEKYFGVAGIKTPTYAKVGDTEFGTNPNGGGNSGNTSDGTELLNETLMTQSSFDKFTAVSVSGEQVWTFDAKYGAKMSGFANNATHPNEDWFITPALNLAGKSNVKLTFNHAFGPAAQVPNTDTKKAQYTIWVSNDFNGDVKAATWTELKGMVYGTTGWGYVSSGDIAIPAENLKANCRIAWKYVCNDVSATWEIKEVIVK
jgi:hypothetical protein